MNDNTNGEETPIIEDCFECKLTGSIVFAGVSLYTLNERVQELLKLEERLDHYQLLLRTAEKEAKHEKAEKIIKTLMFQSQSRAFRAWGNYTKQSKGQKSQAKRLLARALNHVMAYNFDKFVKIWQDNKYYIYIYICTPCLH